MVAMTINMTGETAGLRQPLATIQRPNKALHHDILQLSRTGFASQAKPGSRGLSHVQILFTGLKDVDVAV